MAATTTPLLDRPVSARVGTALPARLEAEGRLWPPTTARGGLPAGLSTAGGGLSSPARWALGRPLYPSVPLWMFAAGTLTALGRALSLTGVPQLVIRDLPPPRTPASTAPPSQIGTASLVHRSPSYIPFVEDLLAVEEHEASVLRRRVRRKRAQDVAAKARRHSLRLAAREEPFYIDATSKASRVKAAQLDLACASARMREALARSGVLERPAPQKISALDLCCLGRACGLPSLSTAGDDADPGVVPEA